VTAGFAPRQAEVPQVVVEGTVSGLPSGSRPGWVGINGIAAQEGFRVGPGNDSVEVPTASPSGCKRI
jgi:hypothetical protein